VALTNADKATRTSQSAKPAKSVESPPALLLTGSSSNPDVQFLASKRAHLMGAPSEEADNSAEIAAIDEQLALLGYRA
jgi:hypothetical protein